MRDIYLLFDAFCNFVCNFAQNGLVRMGVTGIAYR